MSDITYQIYSEYDGWCIQKMKGNDLCMSWTWDHEEIEKGVGGEKLFAEILEDMGLHVYVEEVC